jgi:hypothetical protein
MITYVIVAPGEEALGYIRSDGPPSIEDMTEHLSILAGFKDRDDFVTANPGMWLGYQELH